MKKTTLFIAAMLLVGTAAKATDKKPLNKVNRVSTSYTYAKPIVFNEGGVTYSIYPNGEIDFKTPNRKNRNIKNYSAPVRSRGYKTNNRFVVKYDHRGRLHRIGNTTISYFKNNKVRRIGNITITYNRRGRLSQIGGLHIAYTKQGHIRNKKGVVRYMRR